MAAAFVILLLVVFAVWLGPLISIWAFNVLFPMVAIPYTLETWFAALLLSGTVTGVMRIFKQK
jgi:hypothetical protein